MKHEQREKIINFAAGKTWGDIDHVDEVGQRGNMYLRPGAVIQFSSKEGASRLYELLEKKLRAVCARDEVEEVLEGLVRMDPSSTLEGLTHGSYGIHSRKEYPIYLSDSLLEAIQAIKYDPEKIKVFSSVSLPEAKRGASLASA